MMAQKNKIQLFLLHFSGGNCYSFQFLKLHLSTDFDVYPLELPGRGKRMREELLSTESEAIEDYVSQIVSLRSCHPYLIFGHSMGASLGLKVTKRLEELHDPPSRFIAGGNAGPGTGDCKFRSKMNEEELKKELWSLGGIPEEVLNNDELFSFFGPIIRADFRILEEGKGLDTGFKVNCPVTAVMGDKEENAELIENWKNFTTSDFEFYHLPGHHFFIYDHPADLVRIIKNCYDRSVVS